MNPGQPTIGTKCVVVADDLTGACDSAVHFAAAGLRTIVAFGSVTSPGAEVAACSTESRDIDPAQAVCRIRRLAAQVRSLCPSLIFKKIDSTLRGNTGVELVASLEAFNCDVAVVNPAFPAMGRVVESGFLRVTTDSRFSPIEITKWLRSHGAIDCQHVSPNELDTTIERGARFLSTDVLCQEDLVRIVANATGGRQKILWAGSSGLAAVLAAQMRSREVAGLPPFRSGPVLFCIGSDHPVTVEQQRRLQQEREVGTGLASIHRGEHALLLVDRRHATDRLRSVLADLRPAALFATGGDTASLICGALGAERIELVGEFASGIPLGILRSGILDGTPVLTKSGGFGSPDDLIRIADYFHA